MEKSDWIWMNGEFVAWDDANVHVLSHGLHYGTGVFEGIRCYETDRGPAIFRHREHRPVVAFEHGVGARHYGHEPGEIHELLTERAGLRIFDIDGGGPYDRAALRDEVLSLRRWFFFARPWD